MYLPFYGLKEEPFRLTPDPKFLYLAEAHRSVLLTLLRAVAYRKGMAVLTGPIGTGKTTLLHALLVLSERTFPGNKLSSAFLVNPTLTRDEFLEALLDELEISCPSASKARRLVALHERYLAMQRIGGTTLLIIDEAHLLSPELLEEIRLLNNTDTHREKLVQIILSGQPELNDCLALPQMAALRQRIAIHCDLRPLSPAEIRAYIAERLHAGGLHLTSPFTQAALEEVAHHSLGVPRLINLICDRTLTLGFETKRKNVGADMVQDAAADLGLAGNLEVEKNGPPAVAGNGNGRSGAAALGAALPRGQVSVGQQS